MDTDTVIWTTAQVIGWVRQHLDDGHTLRGRDADAEDSAAGRFLCSCGVTLDVRPLMGSSIALGVHVVSGAAAGAARPAADPGPALTLLEIWPGLRVDCVRCMTCGKAVSQRIIAPDVEGLSGLVVRAYVECPECLERRT